MEHDATSYSLPTSGTICNSNLTPIQGQNMKSNILVDTSHSVMPELLHISYGNPTNKMAIDGFVDSSFEAQRVYENNRVRETPNYSEKVAKSTYSCAAHHIYNKHVIKIHNNGEQPFRTEHSSAIPRCNFETLSGDSEIVLPSLTSFKLPNIVHLSPVDSLVLHDKNSGVCENDWMPKNLLQNDNRSDTNHMAFHDPPTYSSSRTHNRIDKHQVHYLSNTKRNSYDSSTNEQTSYNPYNDWISSFPRGYR